MDPISAILVEHIVADGAEHFLDHIWVLLLIPLELFRQRQKASTLRLQDFEKLLRARPPLTPADLQRIIDREFERSFELVLSKAQLMHTATVANTTEAFKREIRNLPCRHDAYTRGADSGNADKVPRDERTDPPQCQGET